MLRQALLLLIAGTAIAFPNPDSKPISQQNAFPIVTTSVASMQGSIILSRHGKQIFSFRGIKYAKAPVDDLRFQPPQPVEKWEGKYDATKDGPACPQAKHSSTSEDCLVLNVYTSKIPRGNEVEKRPVMVFFHPGGFQTGSASSEEYGPQYLLDHDIVLVVPNYRLATLGFLSTGDKEAPGNNGLKDQVQVLKWVKANIATFGGDPDAVTIAGSDAGAISVTLHLVSPLSKGLFNKAIVMSGSSLGILPVPNNQMDLAKKQAQLLHCPEDTSANIIKCLKSKSAQEIADSYPLFKEENSLDSCLTWLPVMERDVGQQRFLTTHPIESIFTEHFEKVPVLTGVTTDEFAEKAFAILAHSNLLQDMEKYPPISSVYEKDTNNSKTVFKELKKFYFEDKPIDNSTIAELVNLYSDGMVGFEVNRGAKILAEKSNESVYYYRFNYKGRHSFFYLPDTNNTVPYGVAHLDDLIYLFHNSKRFTEYREDDPETDTIEKMTTLWTNFVRFGKPIPEQSENLDNVKWEPFTIKSKKYLDIGNKLVLNENLNEKRYAEWEKLFPLSKYHGKNKKQHDITMKKIFTFLACIVLIAAKQSSESSESHSSEEFLNPIITTPLGVVRGTTQTTLGNDVIFSFIGMRYAEPPVGELRFKPPVPVKQWTGEYDATTVRPACPQPASFPTNEDCLFINVHTPKLPKPYKNHRYPVIVYVHPGSLTTLSGNNDYVGPHYLLDRKVVLVTFNYRLAALGFLSTGDKLAPGNNGLKDQVEALRWVKNNIAAFGGDPTRVTLAGYSAGGVSVSAHLLSPMSRGLFHRVMIMSGSAFGNVIKKSNLLELTKKQAQLVDCPVDTNENMINCLKKVPASNLGNSLEKFRVFGNDPQFFWQFVVEADFGQERFLVEDPLVTIQKGDVADVPIMTGITYDELIFLAYPIVSNETALNTYNKDMNKIFPYAFYYDPSPPRADAITTEIKKFYLNDKPVSKDSLEPLGQVYSDTLSGFAINRGARLLSKRLQSNVYYYVFKYKGYHSNFRTSSGTKYAVHFDDQMYVFWNSLLFPKFIESDPEAVVVKKMTTLYANFAYSGNPTPKISKKLDRIVWTPHTEENKQYLEIDYRLTMKSNLFPERYAKCETLFPLPAV
ncbi:hypothetical protein RN001_013634 [Aquatica leii]|uniref:Carboxylesterase type B domain-containing protein n=1 Tax=Aquatica leii TaxID=1421715 RepID=A0AAN7SE09_9COLE|nr:hypothetical protein RN001_013634 [Aquatica leii]